MADSDHASNIVERLHNLRVERGFTIQQMAEACSIPKSSLESYMRFEGARRPGLDALLVIADGMEVSLDWLVGRSAHRLPATVTEKDYAMGCFAAVSGLINLLRERQSKQEHTVIGKETIAGIADAEVAAKTMLVFVENMNLFRNSQEAVGIGRRELHDRIDRLLSTDASAKK